METAVEGMRDGGVGQSLEVVEARFLLCDRLGKGVAVVQEVGFDNVRLQVMEQRRWWNGEAMLLERVGSTGKEALEVAQSVLAVFVVELGGRDPEGADGGGGGSRRRGPVRIAPKSDGARELAIGQERGEKAAQGLRHPDLGSFFEGLDPFRVVLRETTGDAGVTKTGVDGSLVGTEVLKASRPRDRDEEKAEEETVTRGWMDGVHAADGFGVIGP